jgi:DNA-binding transcriptional MerR regulator
MTTQYFSIREVASRLNVKWYRIKYSHMAGLVPEPMRVGNTRLYADTDVRRLEHYFQQKGGNGDDQLEQQDLTGVAERQGLCLHLHERGRLREGLSPA